RRPGPPAFPRSGPCSRCPARTPSPPPAWSPSSGPRTALRFWRWRTRRFSWLPPCGKAGGGVPSPASGVA
ncbi:hypothetical protein LPJCHP_LPJCHP_01295, partial [Dysosmobacter welbionis]